MGGSHRHTLHERDEFELVAADERWPDRHPEAVEETLGWGVRLYEDYWAMLDDEEDLDLVVIAAPHPWHAVYSISALERGIHVFVEKPVTVTVQEAVAVTEAAGAARRLVGVHHQWTSLGSATGLKRFLCDGGLGRIREVVAVMKWYRAQDYFDRNEWAGRRYVEKLPCFDGVLLNQGIHLVNTALQFATRRPGHALPLRVQAEMYRVHGIETEDLACLRCDLEEGVLLIYATVCADADHPVTISVRGEHGEALWTPDEARVRLDDGTEVLFNDEPHGDDTHRNMAACVNGLESHLYCPAAEAMKATVVVNAGYLSSGRIRKVAAEQAGDVAALVDAASAKGLLFSEVGGRPRWTSPGEVVEVGDVYSFDGLADDQEAARP
jgi:predicted dehydrogenase